jgi:hypothetical protein
MRKVKKTVTLCDNFNNPVVLNSLEPESSEPHHVTAPATKMTRLLAAPAPEH